MFADRRGTDGVEASFVVNHLSPYLLTELLLPTLTSGAPSRIVNVTSGAVGLGKRVFDSVASRPAATTDSTGTAGQARQPRLRARPGPPGWTARASRSSQPTPEAPRPT
ncbi:hypothetical protein ACFSNO_32035 [Streptomyces cirratus]